MTYEDFMKECNRLLTVKIGLGVDDMPDAAWRDYHEDGLKPSHALECANDDYWDGQLTDVL